MEFSVNGRIVEEARFILKTKGTVRKTAAVFGISKSTVHNDLSKKLPKINKNLYEKVSKLLNFNTKIRHLRGGESTKQKYLKLNQLKKSNLHKTLAEK